MTAFEAGRSVGRYRILRPLGSGAMGVVYLAQDPQIERLLAIKTVRLEAEREEEIEERTRRLLREAKTAGRLIHPHIVTLFDAGEQDGMLFLAFEYVEGRSLADRLAESLRTGPPMRVAEALRIARETAEGLDHAHRRGIVHRDVKPANLLLAADGGIKISDFGIAKMAGQATELTVTGSVVGSPHYLSPEQVRGEELDGRSDLFSLGVVLYEMLGGRRPFDGDTFTTLLYKILHAEPEPIRLRPGLQPDLARLLGALLAKDPAHRPPDGARVAEEIAALERDLPSEVLAGPAIHAESSADREDALPGTRPAPAPPPPPPPLPGSPGGPGAVAPGTAGLTEGAAAGLGEVEGPIASGSSPGVSSRARRRRMLWLGAALGLALLAAGVTAGVVGLRLLRGQPEGRSGGSPERRVEAGDAAGAREEREERSVAAPAGPVPAPPDGRREEPAAPRRTEAATRPPEPAAAGPATAGPATLPEPPEAGSPTGVDSGADSGADRGADPGDDPGSDPGPAPGAGPGAGSAPPDDPAGRGDDLSPGARRLEQALRQRPELRGAAEELVRARGAARGLPPKADQTLRTGLTLTFDVRPPSAFVLLDGTVLGRASELDPAAGGAPYTLPGPGTYRVKLRSPGLVDHLVLVEASASGPSGTRVSARLAPAPAGELALGDLKLYRVQEAIGFEISPPAARPRARVMVDGEPAGRAARFPGRFVRPATWLRLEPGRHRVSVVAPGFARRDFAVEVSDGASERRQRIEVRLVPED